MLDRLRGMLHWLKALSAYRHDRYGAALNHLLEFTRLDGHPCDYHIAFQATLHILNRQSDQAVPLFEQVAFNRGKRGYRVVSPEYLREYALCYLALINRNDAAKQHWQNAVMQPVSSFARRYLPLVNPDDANGS